MISKWFFWQGPDVVTKIISFIQQKQKLGTFLLYLRLETL